MAAVPQPIHSTLSKIYEAYEKKYGNEPPRQHLGASLIGHECDRYLWLMFRWAEQEKFEGRMLRLFRTGHLEEPRLVEDLRAIGVEVHDKDPSGAQWQVFTLGGHFGGSMDAALHNVPEAPKTWHVAEFKTSSEKKFLEMQKKGVREANKKHFAQMTTYMGLTGMTRALYIMKNKNTDELHVERIEFDEAEFKRIVQRAERVIKSAEPPARCAKDASWYVCKQCPMKDLCWQQAAPQVNCRTCAHSTPELDGDKRWSCALLKKNLAYEVKDGKVIQDEQLRGCPQHVYIPALLERFAKPVSSGSAGVVYQLLDGGSTFINGGGQGAFTSQEIRACEGKAALTDPNVREMKQCFGARITEETPE
jgi:CRISPR/Cas system-associated exonuclease Cas4 (RecB family)